MPTEILQIDLRSDTVTRPSAAMRAAMACAEVGDDVYHDDPTVNPAENAGRFFAALRAAKVPAEMHIYSSGGHGFGIQKSGKTSAAWPGALVAWLKEAQLD